MSDDKQEMKINELRDEFEEFAQNCPMGRYSVVRRGDGYDSSHTQIMWDAWKARGLHNLRQPATPSEKLSQAAKQILEEARKIIRASSSRQLAKDWDRRATALLSELRKDMDSESGKEES